MFKVLELRESMSHGFMAYPINELDEEFFIANGFPPNAKYAKMLRRAAPLADDVWKEILEFKTKFHDFKHLTQFVFTDTGLKTFIKQYAVLDIWLQEINKKVKKTKQEPELLEYFSRYNDILNTKVFDLFAADLEKLYIDALKREQEYLEKYNDFQQINLVFDDLLPMYKDMLKEVKAERDKEKNKSK